MSITEPADYIRLIFDSFFFELTVEKISDTSMSAMKEVLDNIVFHNDRISNRVLVVSAFSGMTNLLLEKKKTKAPGVY